MTQCTAVFVLLLGAAVSRAAGRASDAPYGADYKRWRASLEEDLRTNWLPLAGLFWLKPGENTFGSDRSSDIALPESAAPPRAGVFELTGGVVTVRAAAGAAITVGGKPAHGTKLTPDTAGAPTVLELGHLRLHVIRRGERIGIRVKDLDSPALRHLRPLVFFPIDLQYRIVARWVPSDGGTTVDVPNVLGDVTATQAPGSARFTIRGKTYSLMALGGSPDKGLFFVFSDATSRKQTYPSGRFLDTGPVKDGTVVLDFNRAYNPPCAVTPYATCPLPPAPNRLPIPIPAGEQYRGH